MQFGLLKVNFSAKIYLATTCSTLECTSEWKMGSSVLHFALLRKHLSVRLKTKLIIDSRENRNAFRKYQNLSTNRDTSIYWPSVASKLL